MASLNELAYNILNKLSGGRATNNSYISLNQIKFNINYYRSLIIHRDLQRNVLENDSFYQFITVHTEPVEAGLSKTVDKIPNLVRLDHRYALRVGNDKNYPLTNPHRIKFKSYSKFTSDAKYSYIQDGYLYIEDDINEIGFMGIFEDPSEAYIADGEDPENVDDFHYPISGDMSQRISQSLINGDMEILLQVAPDVTKDNLPNMGGGQQQQQ